MASGWGINGGPGRCFPFWQEVLACYVVNNSPDDTSGQRKCLPAIEDYYECLYHSKEKSKALLMQQEMNKRLQQNPRENTMSLDEIRTLGLIPGQKPEDVNLKPARWIPHLGPRIT